MAVFIINQTFFFGDLFIPNLNNPSDLEKLNISIAKFEPQCLLEILGYPLFKKFGEETSDRMSDLLNGADYTDGEGNLRRWNGLKYADNLSLIAAYIYFYHLKKTAEQTSGVGTNIPKKEAGQSVSPAHKMATAWNYFSEQVCDMRHFLWLKKDIDGARVYPEFSYHQYFETKRITRPIDSIFQF